MDIETRKARAKILRRILNSLTVEISQLKALGESDTGDLEHARQAINRFCDKLWTSSLNTAGPIQIRNSAREQHPERSGIRRI